MAAEANYIAVSSTTHESVQLQQLLANLTNKPTKSTVIHGDNQFAIAMAEDPQFQSR